MQQLRKLQKLIIGMGEALLCYGAEISRVEETIQRVADHYQVEEVEMYVITNGLFVNLHQQEDYTYTRLKYVPSISVNLKKLCDINELSRRIEQENLSIDTAFERLQEIQKAKNEPVWELVFSSGVGADCVWLSLWRKPLGLPGSVCVRCDPAAVFQFSG